jgi:hypothetical protein
VNTILRTLLAGIIGALMTSGAKAADDLILFYSKNNCKGHVSAQFRSPYYQTHACKRGQCKNDDARSVFIQRGVRLPLRLTVWDSPDRSYGGDDWASIRVWAKSQSMKTGFGVCIPSFEANYGKTWMNIEYEHGGNLDGKVSLIEYSQN